MFGAITLLGMSMTSYAQGHDQRHEREVLQILFPSIISSFRSVDNTPEDSICEA